MFDAVEPVEQFFGVSDDHLYSPDFSDVCRWVERARHFRSLDNIVGIVGRFPTIDDRQQKVRSHLLYILARSIVVDNPRQDIGNLCEDLDLHANDRLRLMVQGLVSARRENDTQRVSELLDAIRPSADSLDYECKRICASFSLDAGRDDLAILYSPQFGSMYNFQIL